MWKMWKLLRIVRQLQDYRVFLRLTLTNHSVEFVMSGSNGAVITGDEYTARRYLRKLAEDERRALEWAEGSSRNSGRTAVSRRG